MKAVLMLAGAGALTILLSGCAPELDQTGLSPEEQAWAANIKANYGAWQPPESVPRSVRRDDLPETPANNDGNNEIPAAADAPVTTPVAANKDVPAVEPVTPADAPANGEAADAPAGKEIPEEYVVVEKDTLGGIAHKFYGKASVWPKIQEANADLLKGKTLIRPGMKLKLPRP